MKTSQMQNPESTGQFLKLKLIIFIVLIVFCLIGVTLCFTYPSDKYTAKIYENTESVEKVFVSNQKAFMEVAHLLKNSELYDYLYSIGRKSIFSTSIPQRDKYFTEEEYKFLCEFHFHYNPL